MPLVSRLGPQCTRFCCHVEQAPRGLFPGRPDVHAPVGVVGAVPGIDERTSGPGIPSGRHLLDPFGLLLRQVVLLGPVVKVDEADLPRQPNIHYLGGKSYEELPSYIAGWDVALLPFAKCEATRYISPTKTPEYLAAGKPVVSTSIRDVVRPYAVRGLVRIADTPSDFVAACEAAMSESDGRWLQRADAFLAPQSWDATWEQMEALLERAVRRATREVSGELSIAPAERRLGGS